MRNEHASDDAAFITASPTAFRKLENNPTAFSQSCNELTLTLEKPPTARL
jgi:hypothetical protein